MKDDSIRKLDKAKLPVWDEIPLGWALLSEGSDDFKTGGWRSQHPVLDPEKCTSCLFCWIYCPDSAIRVKDGKMAGFDESLCKGCGICSTECPQEAIKMAEGAGPLKEGE